MRSSAEWAATMAAPESWRATAGGDSMGLSSRPAAAPQASPAAALAVRTEYLTVPGSLEIHAPTACPLALTARAGLVMAGPSSTTGADQVPFTRRIAQI